MKRKLLSILALLLVAVTGSTHLYAASINWTIMNVFQPSNPDEKADGYVAYLFVTENTSNVPVITTTLSDVTTLLNQGKISDAIELSSAKGNLSMGMINNAPTNISNNFDNGDRLTAFAIIFDASKATEAEHYYLVNGGNTSSVSFTSGTGTRTLMFGSQNPNSRNAANWLSIPVILAEDADNSATMASNYGKEANITLTRTLQAGGWNTFAVPFSTAIPSGWTVKQLASSSLSGDLLTLNFEDATSIAAGTPYLVKVNANVVNPTFEGVTITDDFHPVETNDVTFFPISEPTPVDATIGEKILFIQDGHTLTWAKNGGTIKAFRAVFILEDASRARSFEMNFGDETTGIKTIGNASVTTGSSAVYDLQGRRVENPTHGLYIVNGKKVMVK